MDDEFLRSLDWGCQRALVPGRSTSESPEETSHRLRRIARRRGNKRVQRALRTEFSSYLDRLHP